jgi:hypothetical protein
MACCVKKSFSTVEFEDKPSSYNGKMQLHHLIQPVEPLPHPGADPA